MRGYLSLTSMQQGMLVACDDGILQCIAHCVLNMHVQESRALLLPKLMSAAAEHLIGRVRNSSRNITLLSSAVAVSGDFMVVLLFSFAAWDLGDKDWLWNFPVHGGEGSKNKKCQECDATGDIFRVNGKRLHFWDERCSMPPRRNSSMWCLQGGFSTVFRRRQGCGGSSLGC